MKSSRQREALQECWKAAGPWLRASTDVLLSAGTAQPSQGRFQLLCTDPPRTRGCRTQPSPHPSGSQDKTAKTSKNPNSIDPAGRGLVQNEPGMVWGRRDLKSSNFNPH